MPRAIHYRIVNEGEHKFLQIKKVFGWRYLTAIVNINMDRERVKFNNAEDIEEYLVKNRKFHRVDLIRRGDIWIKRLPSA